MHSTSVGPAAAGLIAEGAPLPTAAVSGVGSVVVVLLVEVRDEELELEVLSLAGASVGDSPPQPATRTIDDKTTATVLHREPWERWRPVGELIAGPSSAPERAKHFIDNALSRCSKEELSSSIASPATNCELRRQDVDLARLLSLVTSAKDSHRTDQTPPVAKYLREDELIRGFKREARHRRCSCAPVIV